MSPINRRRWLTFKANRRAFISLWLIGLFFLISLMAEVIANDRPIVVKFDGQLFFPSFQTVTERQLGGDLEILADFQDPYILAQIASKGWALFPPIRFSYNTISYAPGLSFPSPPSEQNILGTDDHGRDVFARLLYGFRLSVLFGLCLAFICSSVGVLVGVIQGYFGGALDLWSQRFMEIWSGIPVLYLIIIISSMVQMTFAILLLVMLLFGWMGLVGLVRAESLRVRNLEYVVAARALGVTEWRIMLRHVLPNALVAVISVMPFQVNGSIIALTSLDFLGFGLPSGYPSLGEMVAQGKNNLHAPWIGITVFIALASMLTGLVLIGEGIRDAFDPRVFKHRAEPMEQQ